MRFMSSTVCKVLVAGVVSACCVVCIVNIVCFMYLSCCGCNVTWCSVCSGWSDFCLSCDACSAMFCLMGSMLVSSCRFCGLVSRVHLVVMRSAVLYTVCSLLVFASEIIDD